MKRRIDTGTFSEVPVSIAAASCRRTLGSKPTDVMMIIPMFALALMVPLLWAMLEDLRCRRVPNIVPVALVLLFVGRTVATGDHARWLPAVAAAVVLFAPLFLAWTRGWIGAGDVKLAAALGLWVGLVGLPVFVLTTALLGGLLALIVLAWHRWLPLVPLASPGVATASPAHPTIPYAIAIGIAGLVALLPDLLA